MRTVTLVLSAAAAATLLSGCGSSRLSHGEFVKQANAICTEYTPKLKPLGRPQSVTEIETYAKSVLARYRAALTRLEALKPPKDDEVTVGLWLAADRRIEKDFEAIASAAQARRIPAVQAVTQRVTAHNAQSNRLARELGLTACA